MSIKKEACLARIVSRVMACANLSDEGRYNGGTTFNEIRLAVWYKFAEKDIEDDVEKIVPMQSWWMDAPHSEERDKDLWSPIFLGFRKTYAESDRYFPIVANREYLESLVEGCDFKSIDFNCIDKIIDFINSEVEERINNRWFEPSNDEAADFQQVYKNQGEIKALYNEYHNLSIFHMNQKKEIKKRICSLFEFNYYVVAKAFMDRSPIPYEEDVEAVEKWVENERKNRRRLQRAFYLEGNEGDMSYNKIVSLNKAFLSKAKKRKADIDACYIEICNKIEALRNAEK